MAVIQISRIQLRRGKKNTGTGLPQLASGELGWAIDTQELYVGNGSVSEGAPAVGNTKILTEQDDILSLVAKYSYKKDEVQTGTSLGAPIERGIQDKLDDIVNVRDFGATGDGSDQTTQLQRAIDELYLKDTRKDASQQIDYQSKVAIYFPAGEYLVTTVLKIPPFATLIGEGKDKTKIIGSNSNIFSTVNELSSPDSYGLDSASTYQNQAQYITIKGFELGYSGDNIAYGGLILLQSCRNSVFEDLKLVGNWVSGNGVGNDFTAIKMNSLSTAVSSNYNTFRNVEIEGFANAILSDYDVYYNNFDGLNVQTCGYGINFGATTVIGAPGQSTGPSYNKIESSTFKNIDRQALNISNGAYNSSINNRYVGVGNNGGSSSQATYAVINFNKFGNTSHADYFERTADLSSNQLYIGSNYIPEISGRKTYENYYGISTSIGTHEQSYNVLRLPADSDYGEIHVDYQYFVEIDTENAYRKGTMTFKYSKDPAQLIFDDSFTTIGADPLEGAELTFSAELSGNYINVTVINLFDPIISDELSYTIKTIA